MNDLFDRYLEGVSNLLRAIEPTHTDYLTVLTLQGRLAQAIAEAQQYGLTSSTRAEVARVSTELDKITLATLGHSFAELCGLEELPLAMPESQIQDVIAGDKIRSVEPLGQYLQYVIHANQYLSLHGVRLVGPIQVSLEQAYISLRLLNRRMDKTRSLEDNSQWATIERTVSETMHLYSRLVILGDPGSGKTTLLRYIALTFARDLGGESGLVETRLGMKDKLLPILVSLRDFGRYLERESAAPHGEGPALFLDYLQSYHAMQTISLPDNFFAQWLSRGTAIVLFDGLDEILDIKTRSRVSRIIEQLSVTYPANRYLVTSRPSGYSGPARLAGGYEIAIVSELDLSAIEQFLFTWNYATHVAIVGEDTPAVREQSEREARSLLEAVQHIKQIRELAVNPLLLTVIALVYRYRASLPERRVELYEEITEILLGTWDEAKGITETVGSGLLHRLDTGDKRIILESIALWMHERQLREISESDLHRLLQIQFQQIYNDSHLAFKASAAFVQDVVERSGILIERDFGVFAFAHLAFQEYFVARAVANRDDFIEYTLKHLHDTWWREIIVLEAGILGTWSKRRVSALIRAIMELTDEPEPFHNLKLANQCLLDVGRQRILDPLWEQIQTQLAELAQVEEATRAIDEAWQTIYEALQ